jgi:hypothetical protein
LLYWQNFLENNDQRVDLMSFPKNIGQKQKRYRLVTSSPMPLTILSFTAETEIGIVEMGANYKK